MRIIDWERNGNVIRFYLGENNLKEWHGDDWGDSPYEHNSGTVYEEFVSARVDLAFDNDIRINEPDNGEDNSPWSKDDMRRRKVPILAFVHKDNEQDGQYYKKIDKIIEDKKVVSIYMGDNLDSKILQIIPMVKNELFRKHLKDFLKGGINA